MIKTTREIIDDQFIRKIIQRTHRKVNLDVLREDFLQYHDKQWADVEEYGKILLKARKEWAKKYGEDNINNDSYCFVDKILTLMEEGLKLKEGQVSHNT